MTCDRFSTVARGLPAALLLVSASSLSAQVPAFPEAVGPGAVALQDSRALPLVVHQVTTTSNSGPGSLRQILQNDCRNDRYDIVIFRTGGRMVAADTPDSMNNLTLSCDHIYIAGQTAPGGGFVFTGRSFRANGRSNFVIRYITTAKAGQSAWQLQSPGPFVGDHLTGYWCCGRSPGSGGANNFGGVGDRLDQPNAPNSTTGIWTLSNVLGSEPHANHATNSNPTGIRGGIYRSAFLGPAWRNPLVSTTHPTGGIEMVNSIVYNWRGGSNASSGTSDITVDFAGIYSKWGPATQTGSMRRFPFWWRATCNYTGQSMGGCEVSFLLSGNRNNENAFPAVGINTMQWAGQILCDIPGSGNAWGHAECGQNFDPAPTSVQRTVDVWTHRGITLDWPYQRVDMTDGLVTEIVAGVGNSRGLTCDGQWRDRRQPYDAARLAEFQNGTGRSNFVNFGSGEWTADPDETGWVVPVPDAGTPCTDTRGDGIPDAWMDRWSLTAADSAQHMTTSGFLLVEHYLNNSDPTADSVSPTPPPPVSPTTFGSGARVYISPIVPRGDDVGPDTIVMPRGVRYQGIHPMGGDSILVCTFADLGTPLDSMGVEDRMASWFGSPLLRALYVRNTCPQT